MTVAERLGYAVGMTRASLTGGGTWLRYGPDGTEEVPDTSSRRERWRQAPRTFRMALAAVNEENARRTAADA